MELSRGLDGKLARLLPCDPAVAPTIQEVSTASQARLSALTAYYQALAEFASTDVIAARKIRDSEQSRLNSIPSERTDTEQERSGIASQLRNLTESVRVKPVLAAAERQLTELEAMTRERATLAGKQSAEGPDLSEALNRWIASLEDREAAAKQLIAATQVEGPLWEQYYTARQARARTECTVTGGGR
jgi:chromosome segregation ATPase